jgi:single-strand DNA-binding protein
MVNRVILVGRVGNDPDMKVLSTGNTVTKFSLATSEKFADRSGQKQEATEWHKIVCWGKLAEICSKYLTKGRMVYIEGKITTVSWDDKQTNQKRYATEIVASSVQFLSDGEARQHAQSPAQNSPNAGPQAPTQSYGDINHLDNIPF